ncbi:beta-glucosidase [Novosphingobium hassiacum]|uniref:Beta-glucosidase n=1 Tax=Novosphingobium hassiacum TaxID=173676 RepID=A0A7W6EV55_9SPHN|nr:glycoside hydrolase family 3 protein [Novosphingobium hassiacum]MBB3859610.1 beta-glucosidase [Novosphingobium hassiacum]
MRSSALMAAVLLSGSWAAISRAEQPQAPAAPTMQTAPEATAHPSAWPAARSPSAFSTSRDEARISAIMAKMTLEQKVGQLIQADISAITPEDLAKYPLGSILAGGNSGPYGDERADGAKWAKLVAAFHAASRNSGAGIPVLFGVDAVHGHSNLPGSTIFPHNIGLGAARDPALIQRIGAATAAEIAGTGIDWTFAPTLAVPQDLRWGRSYEGYAADPALVSAYGKAMVRGLQGTLVAGKPLGAQNVAATAKHFLADGGTAEGKDQGDARISERELIATHAMGYPAAIDAGALTVMASFSTWNGAKHHGNKSLLTGVLKERMGFAGLVVGDWNGHGQIPGCTVTDCPAAINAGLDLFMAPESWKPLFANTLREAREGVIPAARIDDAVRRILRVKLKLGMLDAKPVERGNPAMVGAPAHLAIAREAVAKSLVLLKNEGGVLPLRPGAKVLITGHGADNMAMQAGGWTITWQGTDTTSADFPKGQTIGQAIASQVIAAGGQATLSTEGTSANKPDVAVVVLGERPYAEFQGDLPDIAFRTTREDDALIARLKAQGTRIVTVFLSGRPMFASKLINQSDAFVAAWLPGSQGIGVADVLVAQANGKPLRDFTGKLPFAWPDDAHSPVLKPAFPTGYGLSYAKPASVARLNEDPRMELAESASAENYFVRGNVPAPWHLGIDGAITSRAVDLSAQEDARQFTWNADGSLSIEGTPVDLMRQLNGGFALLLDWRIDRAVAGPIKVSFGEATLDIGDLVRAAPSGSPVQTRIPLTCFKDAGANFTAVGAPLRIAAPVGFTATLRNVNIEGVGVTIACPPVQKK